MKKRGNANTSKAAAKGPTKSKSAAAKSTFKSRTTPLKPLKTGKPLGKPLSAGSGKLVGKKRINEARRKKDEDDEEDPEQEEDSGGSEDDDGDEEKSDALAKEEEDEENDLEEGERGDLDDDIFGNTHTPSNKKKGMRRNKVAPIKKLPKEKVTRLSAATLKTRMSPAMLQNPMARRKIWENVMKMMVRRGYEWVQDRKAPSDQEHLWPNNRGFLSFFHMHAEDRFQQGVGEGWTKREPVYVMFCSKAGEPTLNSLTFPSRHIILVSDSLTGRARAALLNLAVKTPPSNKAPIPTTTITTTTTTMMDSNDPSLRNQTDAFQRNQPDANQRNQTGAFTIAQSAPAPTSATIGEANKFTLKEIYLEAFLSNIFMFDLLEHRYLKMGRFSCVGPDELNSVFAAYDQKRDLSRFPKILDTDPVVKHLRLPIGAVLKHDRLSTTTGNLPTYRVISQKSYL